MSTQDGYDIRKWSANEVQRRPRRRYTAWVMALGLAAIWATTMARTLSSSATSVPMALIWLPVLGFSSPFARDTWWTARGLAKFDEFERAALLRAVGLAFGIFLLLVVALLGLLAFGTAHGWTVLPLRSGQWVDWLMLLLVTGVTLPVFIAELIVPFPPADELEDL